jgi:leader peptidase (prepilin peptidase)/N-methyltransferase
MVLLGDDIPRSWVMTMAFVWGALWGSFVNVVIYRAPREMSVVHPPSHCTSCGAPVRPWDNVPILSWAFLGGRTRCCGQPLSPRYAVVEALGGAVSLGIAEHLLRTLPRHANGAYALLGFLTEFTLGMALLSAAFIDAEHMYLPDFVTLGGTVLGLTTPGLRGMGFKEAFIGAAVGYGIVWLPLIVGYQALRGRPGMGLGDAKLLMLAGAWFGWQGAIFTLFAGAVQATVGALFVLLVRGKIEEPQSVRDDRAELQRAAAEGDTEAAEALAEDPLGTDPGEGLMAARMPFGPFLCLALIEWMIGADVVVRWLPWLRG